MPTASQANVAAAALGSGSSTPNAERQAGDMMRRRALGSRHCNVRNFVPVRRTADKTSRTAQKRMVRMRRHWRWLMIGPGVLIAYLALAYLALPALWSHHEHEPGLAS